MSNKPQSVANLAVGPRALHVIGEDGQTVEQVTLAPGERRDLVLANPDGAVEKSWLNSGELWVGKPGSAPPEASHPGAATDATLALREELQAVKAENESLSRALAETEAEGKQRAREAEGEAQAKAQAAERSAEDLRRMQEEAQSGKAPPAAKGKTAPPTEV